MLLLDTNALLLAMTMPHRLVKRTQRLLRDSTEIAKLLTSDRKMLDLGFDWIKDSYQ